MTTPSVGTRSPGLTINVSPDMTASAGTTATAPWTIIAANDKYFARVQVLQTVVERFARELHVDLSAEALTTLPQSAAPTTIPVWAQDEARGAGIAIG